MDYYFLDDFGGSFKATVMYDPYFLIATKVWSSRTPIQIMTETLIVYPAVIARL